jgi:HD-GYP domain-containing protein (c-di-GMP phosphodiesterase class II)
LRKLQIHAVKPGDIIAKTIFLENGNVLLGAGMELTQRYIERLINLGIDTVYIQDKHTSDIIPEDIIRDETRKHAVESVYKAMTALIDQPQVGRRMSIPDLGTAFRKVFGEIITDLSSRRDVLVNLASLHVMDGYFFHHAVNVAVLAGIIGMAKGYNQQQLLELGVGALLFDIGMTQLPKELWSKKAELNEAERIRIRQHPEEGYNILRAQHNVSLLSAHCALQHHERFDGSGYPRELTDKQINEYAQIVGLADVYDALVSPRPFRKSYSPHEATEFLFAAGNRFFNLELVKLFLKHVAVYPIATTLKLSSGHVGVVSAIDTVAVHRPVVRIIEEPDGSPTPIPYELDLKHKDYMSVTIVKTL